MALHLNTLGWGARGGGTGGRGAPVEAQGSDLTGVEVAQLPGGSIHLFGPEVWPLIPQVTAIAEKPLGLLVLALQLYLEGLAVLVGQAFLSLLDLLVQCFAQLFAQFLVRQTPFAANFGARTFLLGLAATLAAGAGLRRAAVRLITVQKGRFNSRTKKFSL